MPRAETDTTTIPFVLDGGRHIRDVMRDLNARLKSEIDQSGEDGFGWQYSLPPREQIVPPCWTWAACYAVRGGSEGYWVHIDLILIDGRTRRMIGHAKVWSWQAALSLVNAATLILHDEHRVRFQPLQAALSG